MTWLGLDLDDSVQNTDPKSKTWDVVPAGLYEAVLVSSKLTENDDLTKRVMITWELTTAPAAGRKLNQFLTFSPKSAKFLKWQTDVMHVDISTATNMDDGALTLQTALESLYGRLKVDVKVEVSEYNGKSRNQLIVDNFISDDTESVLGAQGQRVELTNAAPKVDTTEDAPF